MSRNNSIIARVKLVALIVVIVFSFVLIRLYYVQISRHNELYAKAKVEYTGIKINKGKRGEIFDLNGNILVANKPCSNIIADPFIICNQGKNKAIASYFAAKLHLDEKKLLNNLSVRTKFKNGKDGKKEEIPNRYAPIAKEIDLDISREIQKETRKLNYKGIFFEKTSKRYYPKDEMLSNILGFTNIDKDRVIAVVGLEKFFEKEISATVKKTTYVRSRDGNVLEQEKKYDVRDGLNLYLTVREPLQSILEEELDKLMEEWNPKAAYAIMADPKNGNILAIAQRPTFNPNDRRSMNPKAWRNRIIEDIIEPGSTVKPLAIAGAIDLGITKPDDLFDCEKGYWVYGGRALRDAHRFEILTVSEIIKHSSNIGTAKIALKMGEENLNDYYEKFGFRKKTGIPLKPESTGIFRAVKDWDTLSITRFPIGQGIAVSPLQLVRAYCVLANGGNYLDLRLVDRIENPDTGIVIKTPLKLKGNIFRNKYTQPMIVNMMKEVTTRDGTAEEAAVKGYFVAGKTGTSQKWDAEKKEYSHKKYIASFIGFVPAVNPRFVLLVTADEPKKKHYGGTVAGPCFRKIARRSLRFLCVPPDIKKIYGDNEPHLIAAGETVE